MTISTGNQEIVIGELHQLIVTARNQENIFSCKSNRTLSEMLRKERYLNLSISFEEYLPEYGDMNIGSFLILLKERGDNKYKMFLNRNGDKLFCKFTLTDGDLSKKGLYVYVLNNEIKWEEGKHTLDKILNADEVIKSPGIPDGSELIQKLHLQNIPVISEVEFAFRYTKAKIAAITGSNGKTTTTLLLGHVLKNAGYDVLVAGNVGVGFALSIAETRFSTGSVEWRIK